VRTGLWWRNLIESEHLGDLGMNGNLIFIWILKSGMGVDWINLAQCRVVWWALVKKVMNLLGSISAGNFLTS